MRSPLAVGSVLTTAIVTRLLTATSAWATNGSGHFMDHTDSLQYLALAAALAAGEGFVCAPGVDFTPPGGCPASGAAEVFRTPGYPLFLAVGQLIGYPVLVAVVFQVLIGAGTAVLVYRLAHRVASTVHTLNPQAVALGAGLLYAADPLSILHSTYVLSETLFAAVFVGHLLLALRHLDTGSMRTVAAAGGAAALAILIRPAAFYWPGVAAMVILLRHRRRTVALATAVVFLFAAFGPPVAWKLRNTYQAGYSGFSSVREVNLHLWVGASVQAQATGAGFNDTQAQLRDQLAVLAAQNNWTRAEQYRHMAREGVRAISSAPGAAIIVYVRNLLRTFGPTFSEYAEVIFRDYSNPRLIGRILTGDAPPIGSYWFVLPMYAWLVCMCAATVVLGLVGVRAVLWRMNLPVAILLASGVYFAALMPGAGDGGTDRMRHPVMPAICVLAGIAISGKRNPTHAEKDTAM